LAYTHALVVLGALALASGARARTLNLTFCCRADNDLYTVLAKNNQRCERFDAPMEAVDHARDGSAVLILADGYPETTTTVPPKVFDRAREKDLRLFIEYPAALPGIEVGPPRKTTWERVVVSSDAFGKSLARLRIVGVHDCRYVPAPADNPLLVVAKVAGFDTAVFGLPEKTSPILFEVPDRKLTVATTRLSGFVTGRYAPTTAWKTIWEHILSRLDPGERPRLEWTPIAHPAYGAADKLPARYERKAFDSAANWYFKSRLLVSAPRQAKVEDLLAKGVETVEAPDKDAAAGDGSRGILEGYASAIRFDGAQGQRLPLRADCQAETSAVLALNAMLNGDARSRKTASNLLDYVYFTSGMCGGARGNPKHPAYGLVAWGAVSRAWEVANYSDDDARVMLATMLSSACLGSDKWDAPLMRALLANLRTTGPQGFRDDRIDMPQLEAKGWKYYHDTERVNYSTHHESYLWACNLWAYRQTGYRPFLERTETAIRMTMAAFPNGWRWNDSIERARMLLCLAWLVRVDDTPEHRAWLSRIADEVIARQQPCGAVDEIVGGGRHGYQIAASNDDYGTTETPLIQENGDPVSDQLYTTGFALLGLHEAYAATGDRKLKASEDRLAEYVCRIQVRSTSLPYLDGAWFRAFDHGQWDYWASSGDVGWGAWCVETGWGQAWTALVLGLRQKKTSMWDITAASRVADQLEPVSEQMKQNDGSPWTGAPWKGSRE
jgi:hypothetical protein